MRPAPWVDRIAGQRLVFGEAQNMQDFSLKVYQVEDEVCLSKII